MSQSPSPVNYPATSAAPSPPSPQQVPNGLLPLDGSSVGVVDDEEVQASPDRLVAEQQQPLDGAGIEEGGEDDDSAEDEYISVDLRELCPKIKCPIYVAFSKTTVLHESALRTSTSALTYSCTIKKCCTIAECLHRFCKDCIDKAMRIGKNECPICHIHCPSRCSLKKDPKFDTLISILIPDIEKFEEEEMPFLEEERIQNEQITAAIVEIARRQSEAMSTKRRRHT